MTLSNDQWQEAIVQLANELTSSVVALTSVAGATGNTSILAANAARKTFFVYNDSAATLYLAYGSTASTTAFTTKVAPSQLYEMPSSSIWQGTVSGIWDSATGAARITEIA